MYIAFGTIFDVVVQIVPGAKGLRTTNVLSCTATVTNRQGGTFLDLVSDSVNFDIRDLSFGDLCNLLLHGDSSKYQPYHLRMYMQFISQTKRF